MKVQHLVLDPDVHRLLKERKAKTGLTVKEIGNSALRMALGVPTKEELLLEKLVASGKLTREEYERARAEAEKEAQALQVRALEAAVPGRAPRTWTIGGWTVREIYRSPDRQLQIGEQWTEGGKGVSTPVLVHDASHLWAVVLAGKVQVVIEGEERVLGPGEAVHVPPGTPHRTAPLTNDAQVLLLASPEVELPE